MNNFGLLDYISGGHREFAIRQTLLSAYADIFAQPQTADPSATAWHLPY